MNRDLRPRYLMLGALGASLTLFIVVFIVEMVL